MIFRLGEQKLNDFSVGEENLVKNNRDNKIQSVTLCSMYFSKKVCTVCNGVWGKAPEAGEFSRIFVLKVTLQCVRSVSYRKKVGAGCTNCSCNNFLGEQLFPQFPYLCFCIMFWRLDALQHS